MATVKIIAEEGEHFDFIQDRLIKAFEEKEDDKLLTKRFDDPLMNVLNENLDQIYLDLYPKMIKEIVEVLKES